MSDGEDDNLSDDAGEAPGDLVAEPPSLQPAVAGRPVPEAEKVGDIENC